MYSLYIYSNYIHVLVLVPLPPVDDAENKKKNTFTQV